MHLDDRANYYRFDAAYWAGADVNDYVVTYCDCITTDTWIHLTAVFDDNAELFWLYRDGTVVDKAKMPCPILAGDSTLYFGTWNMLQRYLSASIDDFAVWSRALSLGRAGAAVAATARRVSSPRGPTRRRERRLPVLSTSGRRGEETVGRDREDAVRLRVSNLGEVGAAQALARVEDAGAVGRGRQCPRARACLQGGAALAHLLQLARGDVVTRSVGPDPTSTWRKAVPVAGSISTTTCRRKSWAIPGGTGSHVAVLPRLLPEFLDLTALCLLLECGLNRGRQFLHLHRRVLMLGEAKRRVVLFESCRCPSSRNSRMCAGEPGLPRKGIHVDRIASAWLLRRFIHPVAKREETAGEQSSSSPTGAGCSCRAPSVTWPSVLPRGLTFRECAWPGGQLREWSGQRSSSRAIEVQRPARLGWTDIRE